MPDDKEACTKNIPGDNRYITSDIKSQSSELVCTSRNSGENSGVKISLYLPGIILMVT